MEVLKLAFHAGFRTNNEAEYLGLIYGLKTANGLGIKNLCVYGDSQLVVSQLEGNFKVRAQNLLPLYQEVPSTRMAMTCFLGQ
jgi:ribonuclease HI